MSDSLKRLSMGLLAEKETRKGVVALVDQAVASGTNFLTGVIVGRACVKEEFGIYILALSIVLFVENIQRALISTPYTVYSPRLQDEEKALYTGSTLVHQLGLSVLAIICLLIFGIATSLGMGPNGLKDVVYTLSVVIAFVLLREYARQVCFASLRMTTALFLDLGVAIVQIGGLLLLAYASRLSPSVAYWMTGLACGLPAIGWLVSDRKHFAPRPADAAFDLRRNWSFAKWLLATSLVYTASIQLYPWLLSAFHGTAATGVLGACMGVLFFANPFLLGMTNFLGPKTAHAFADGGAKELRRIVAKASIFLTIVMGLFCVVMIVYGGRVVEILYGEKYAGSGPVVGLLALSQLAVALTFPVNSGLLAMERPDAGFKSYLLATVVTLALGLRLVKSFGPVGAACGLLTGNIVASAFRCVAFIKQMRVFCVIESES